MADTKISQLPGSTTPLAGTEVLPIVQSGTTKQVSVANLTAGRNVACADLTTTGNVILGDASTDNVQVNGYMGVGGVANPSYGINISSSALTGTSQRGILSNITSSSGATVEVIGVSSKATTAAAAFTSTDVYDFFASTIGKGAGSTITNAHGIKIADQTQGTNNYGITSQVSSGANKWNIYASGTAANYFAGNVGIGTSAPSANLEVAGAVGNFKTTGHQIFLTRNGNNEIYTVGASSILALGTNSAEKMRIDSAGNTFIGTTTNTNSSKLVVNGTISETVSSTQYLVASQADIGTAPNEIPLNGYLGSLAYQDTAPVAAPASATAAGSPGQIAYDSSYFYVCTAVNTWKRVAIATW